MRPCCGPRFGVLGIAVLLVVLGACSSSPSEPTALAATTVPTTPDGPRPSTTKACPDVERGSVTTHHLRSAATHRTERYRIYQPPGTGADDRLRVLVLLHGAQADETQWLDVGITSAADCMGGRGERNNTLIVLVDGSTVERDRGADPAPIERLVVDEILPAVRKQYPNALGRNGTGIGGISLGGGWAIEIAAHHPDLFGAAGGHSPALGRLSADEILSLARHNTRLWTDVGTSDALRPRVDDQSERMRRAHVGVMSMHWDGQHDRRYWSQHTEDYLRFYAETW